MWSDLLASEKQTEVSVQHFYKLFYYDGRQEYEMLICHSISVEIVLIQN